MIDFVSTRESTDPETRKNAQLLASIIAQFIRDASTKPSDKEANDCRNWNEDASRAVAYLFDEGSPFEDHIELLGGSAATFRAALRSDRSLDGSSLFTTVQRRIIQARLRWYRISHVPTPETQESTS